MSRCFPYPPPGYCRNGATYEALIESIKLQKETDKAKAERKKERKEKKKREKENRKKDEKLKLQKNQIPDSVLADFKEAQIGESKINNEQQLERSDLTEEHGQPIKPSHSSESTQNSNKRRRDGDDNDKDVLVPDDSTGHGMPIKIRFPKKQKGSDSSNSGEDARFSTVPGTLLDVPTTSLTQTKSNPGFKTSLTQAKSDPGFERTKVSNPNGLHVGREQAATTSSARPILPSGSKNSNVKVLKSSRQQIGNSVTLPKPSFERTKVSNPKGIHVGREQAASTSGRPILPAGSKNSDLEVLKSSRQQVGSSVTLPNPGFERTKVSSSNGFNVAREQAPASTSSAKLILPSGLEKNDVQVVKSSRQQIGSSAIPVWPGHLKQDTPGPSVSRSIGAGHGLSSSRQQQGPSSLKPVIPNQIPNKSGPSSTGKRPISEIKRVPEGPSTDPEKKKEVGPTRSEKKMLKKKAKYEKVIGSWVPTVLVAPQPPSVDDEDWLSKRTKTSNASTSRGEAETCRELAATTALWHPRARFLAEADVYALPYTVPF